VLFGAIALGLILGLAAGGSLDRLASVRLRLLWLIFLALGIRVAFELAVGAGWEPPDAVRVGALALSYGALLVGLWPNLRYPGIRLAFVGVLSNGLVILVNGGRMPIWEPSLIAAGFVPADAATTLHILMPPTIDASFLLRLGPLADVVPIPLPFVRNVASLGDLFLSAGLAFFLFAAVIGRPAWLDDPSGPEPPGHGLLGRGPGMPTTGSGGLAEAAALDRPSMLGGSGGGVSSPAVGTVAGLPAIGARVRQHPYVRLALNGSFSALWFGQVISSFGDRVHQVAVAFQVLGLTGSPIAVSGVFLAAFLPNLLLGPVAGVLVDRWDRKEVMVVSDLLRAAAVLLVPVAAAVDILLVYPLVFAVTCVTIFFRPARTAVMPLIVDEDELLAANSATWVGEMLADVVGYPIAGLFVAFLGSALALAFWIDAATYVASAVLIATMAIPAVAKATVAATGGVRGVVEDLRIGWHFLRSQSVLMANTVQGAIAQVTGGTVNALMPVYAAVVLVHGSLEGSTAYAFLETGIGLGSLVGGFAVGLVGTRLAKGRMVIAGFVLLGLCVVGLGLTSNVAAAIGLMVGVGVANMVYVIPSQTLFQELTPPHLIGRVVSLRFALVTASMSVGMALAGVLAEAAGVTTVIVVSGVVTIAAGLAGLLTPSVRDA
jgi:DHA3 family macrolide efflux protein-like MFS transporter